MSPRTRKAPKLDIKTILSIIPKLNIAPTSALARSLSPSLTPPDPINHTKQR